MFFRYYIEIKSRFFILLISGSLIFLVGYIFKEILLSIVLNSYNTNNNSHIELSYFIFTDVLEVFNVYVCLIFFLAKQVLFFQLCYHLLMFLARGLTKSEYRYFLQLFSLSSCFFVLAVVLFKKFLFSFSWNFFLSFKNFVTFKSLTVHFEAKLLNYVMFFTDFYFSCVLYFQFFLLPFFLIIYFKVEPNSFKSLRKILYYGCILFSTLITPPDVTSQIFLSLVFIIGCEILVYCALFKSLLTKLIR